MSAAYIVIIALLAICGLFMALERRGAPLVLTLNFKGDIKRESRWVAQYGQFLCTLVAAMLIWRLDGDSRHTNAVWTVLIGVLGTSLLATIIKRSLGRIRPGRDDAGQFLGPTFRHANFRESFPSAHSACAVALTVILCHFYPGGAVIFWPLALTCAVLRYLMDAHWPSDVFGGIAMGYGAALVAIRLCAH